MDEEHSNQAPRATSVQRPVQPQPTAADAGAASAKTKGGAKAGADKSGVVESSTALTAKAERPKPSEGLTAVFGGFAH
jgi:hypothetical protein